MAIGLLRAIFGTTGGGAIVTFTHDLGGSPTLYGYAPEPAARARQGEQIANSLYGMQTRSPKTPYICAWRDPTRFRPKADAGPPREIFLNCNLGTSAWSPPENLIEHADQANRRDQANVAILWARRDGGYVATRLQVEVGNLAAGRNFRSVWSGDEIAQLAIDWDGLVLPASPVDPIGLAVTGSLPRRYNIDEPATSPTATFRLVGTVPPIPDWLNY